MIGCVPSHDPFMLRLTANSLSQEALISLPFLLVLACVALSEQLTGNVLQLPLPLAHLDRVDGVVSGDLWIVLRPLIACMATRALNSGLWVQRLLAGGPRLGAVPRLRG